MREEGAVVVERQLGLDGQVAGLIVGEERFAGVRRSI